MNAAVAGPLATRVSRSRHERLVTTLVFAVLAHGILLLGIGFVAFAPIYTSGNSVNIALVNSAKTAPPQHAAYLARIDQRGPGNTRRHVLTRPAPASPAPFPNPGFALANQFDAALSMPNVVTTRARSATLAPGATEQTEAARPRLFVHLAQPAPRLGAVHARSIELPRLYGPNAQSEAYSVNALAALSAPYRLAWQRRVERVGTAQFARLIPDSVRGGHLTLAVTLNSDGSVRAVVLAKRSHQPLLDAAALKIIRLAAPFPPFPPALAAQSETLSFSYRWNFIRGVAGSGMLGLGGH